MRLSEVKVSLAGKDILSIIEQFVNVEGLSIKSIKIDELINVEGEYKKGAIIPFSARLGLGSVVNNTINVAIFNVKVGKIGILDGVKKIAMKAFLSELTDIGIKVQGENLNIDMNKLSKIIPYVYFNLKQVEIHNGFIEVQADNVIYTEEKQTISIKHEEIKKRKSPINDKYTKLRKKITNKVPAKYENIVKYSMILPDMIALLYRLFLDKRVEAKTKILVGGILSYLVSPIDILPDFIPFIGQIDDIAVAFYGINSVINDVPHEIILENWQGEENVIDIVRDGVNYISKVAGSDNIVKLVNFIKGFSKNNKEEGKNNEEGSDIH